MARKKGTPNSRTVDIRAAVSQLLSLYIDSNQMAEDFASLEPKDRLLVADKLLDRVVPKLQATAIDLAQSSTDTTLEQRLAALAAPPPPNSGHINHQ